MLVLKQYTVRPHSSRAKVQSAAQTSCKNSTTAQTCCASCGPVYTESMTSLNSLNPAASSSGLLPCCGSCWASTGPAMASRRGALTWCCARISLRLLSLAPLAAPLPMRPRGGLLDLLGDRGAPGDLSPGGLSMGWGYGRRAGGGDWAAAASWGWSGMGLSGGRPEDPLDRKAGLEPAIQSPRLGWRTTKRELEPPEPAQSRREGRRLKASMWSSREAGRGMAKGADLGPQGLLEAEKGLSDQLPPSASLSEEAPRRGSSEGGGGWSMDLDLLASRGADVMASQGLG